MGPEGFVLLPNLRCQPRRDQSFPVQATGQLPGTERPSRGVSQAPLGGAEAGDKVREVVPATITCSGSTVTSQARDAKELQRRFRVVVRLSFPVLEFVAV